MLWAQDAEKLVATVQVEEYMEGGEQGPYAYSEEAYQAAQHMAAAQAAANNGQVGQYGAPSVHHDAQVRALCCQAHPRHSLAQCIQMLHAHAAEWNRRDPMLCRGY